MTDNKAQTIRRRSTGGRIGLFVTGAVAGLLALAALGVCAAAFSVDSEKND